MKRAATFLSLFLAIYVLSYFILSLFGAYAPSAWGLGQQGMRPKWYAWAPLGIYDPATGRWLHPVLRIFYAPLSFADDRLWHTHGHFPEDSDPQHPAVFPGFTSR
jgi:hypothetical protein